MKERWVIYPGLRGHDDEPLVGLVERSDPKKGTLTVRFGIIRMTRNESEFEPYQKERK